DWIRYHELMLSGQEPFEEYERVKRVVADFTRTKTKAELLDAALQRGLLMAPVATIDDVVHSSQLEARGYFQALEHPELGMTVRYPGPFAQFGGSPITYRRRPPRLGEHTEEVMAQIDERSPATPFGSFAPPAADGGPLSGVKILDFMWA